MDLIHTILRDGALVVDNSMLSSWNQCPRQFWYCYGLRRIPDRTRSALDFGGAIHEALAYRYRNDPHMRDADTASRMEEAFVKAMTNVQIDPEDYRTVDYGIDVLRGYNAKYGEESFDVLAVEASFAVPLDTVTLPDGKNTKVPAIYSGKMDLVVNEQGQILIPDHKTTSIFGESFFVDMHVAPQMTGYVWAWNKLNPSYQAIGYRTNAIATRRPTRTGKGIEFERSLTYVDSDRIREWKRNTIQLIREMVFHLTCFPEAPQRKHWCVGKYGRCAYYDVCSLPNEQRETLLYSGNFKDNTWSPLNQPE